MKKRIVFLTFVVIHLLFLPANADEPWRIEFNDLCGKTEESMTMNTEELNGLIDRCDKLKPIIEGLDNPQKKVFLKRLEMCRNLFIYMLETKKKNQ